MEWISVKDRMPKKLEDVLIIADKVVCMAYRDDRGHWMESIYFTSTYSQATLSNEIGETTNITHWQSLPEPPKE